MGRTYGVNSGSQFRSPYAASWGKSTGKGGSGAGGANAGRCGSDDSAKLARDDALAYVKEVKETFRDRKEKYDMFVEVLHDFKLGKTDRAVVIESMKRLFKGHNNLLFGFNTFLPKGYQINIDQDHEAPPKNAGEFERAISFINKIKCRFQNDEYVYKAFLDIMKLYEKNRMDLKKKLHNEVFALFENRPDLCAEFLEFSPKDSTTSFLGTQIVKVESPCLKIPKEEN